MSITEQVALDVGAVSHVENSTDATRGAPIVLRAQTRKAELEAALDKLRADELRARSDIELALSSVNALLTGDLEHLSEVTAFELNRWLEHSKHLAEAPPLDAAAGPTA